jgi:predicted Zn-dependent protease
MRSRLLVTACAMLFSTCAFFRSVAPDPFSLVDNGYRCKAIQTAPVPWEEEYAIGGAVALGLASKSGGFALDPLTDGGVARPDSSAQDQLNLAVAEIGLNLASYSARPNIPWTFGTLASDVANAYSAPSGYVLVTHGLLLRVENEAQLAGVLAHEIGHVTRRHALRVFTEEKSYVCLSMMKAEEVGVTRVQVGDGRVVPKIELGKMAKDKLNGFFDTVIGKIVEKGYAQADEYEADAVAAELLLAAGYDPREFQKLLSSLPEGPGVWPNHPPPKERAAKLEPIIRDMGAGFALDQAPKVPLDPRLASAKKP